MEAINTDQYHKSLNETHSYSTRNKNVPKLPRAVSKSYHNCFLLHCIKNYTNLTKDTRDSKTIQQFNTRCKRELLKGTT